METENAETGVDQLSRRFSIQRLPDDPEHGRSNQRGLLIYAGQWLTLRARSVKVG